MTTNINDHTITNVIVQIRQLFFHMLLFYQQLRLSVVFSISSSHADTNLPNRHFLHEQFLMFKYSTIFHALLHSQSHVQGFHI